MNDNFNSASAVQTASQILCHACKKPVDKKHNCNYTKAVTTNLTLIKNYNIKKER